MKLITNSAILLLLLLSLFACTSTQLSRELLNEKHPTLAQLEKGIDGAVNEGINLLAPTVYQTALNEYLSAYLAASNGQSAVAENSAARGLEYLKNAYNAAATSRQILSEVLDARQRAKQAGADKLHSTEMAENDKKLEKISKLIESNAIEKAKNRRNELQLAYTNLELRSLQQNTVAEAKTAINNARANEAEKFAPKTLANAEEQLTLAKSVLAVDRTNLGKAEKHAFDARVLANRSEQIATTIRDFKQRNLTEEEMILTFQDDIKRLAKSIEKEPLFDKPNQNTITELEKDISAIFSSNNTHRSSTQELEEKLNQANTLNEQKIAQLRGQHVNELAEIEARYSGEISMLGKSQVNLERLQKEQQARFARIQDMFSDSQANVFRQKNDVLISVHGFEFPSGSAEIRPSNFGLMNKIVQAIGVFDGSRIVVSGHTDSTGNADFNKKLSENRAQSVAKFFVDVAGLAPTRIQAKGFGQEKPVASNQSADGRAKNRRVEILIVNE